MTRSGVFLSALVVAAMGASAFGGYRLSDSSYKRNMKELNQGISIKEPAPDRQIIYDYEPPRD